MLLRSLLFVPGNRSDMLAKASGLVPDAFVPDLEDSVPDGEKGRARDSVCDHLAELSAGGRPVFPRVNGLDTPWILDDLAAVVGPHVRGISVGKVSTPADLTAISDIISTLEVKAGLPEGGIALLPWIETAEAVVRCYELCRSSSRIVGIGFGAEDFTHEMRIERKEDESEVAYARSAVCIAARAARVLALDSPYFRFKDEEGLRRNIAASRQAGFKGKFAIHPAQIESINRGFSPSAEEIEYARRVVAAFEEAERAGRGSTSLDGTVIDVPVVKRARAVLEAAEGGEG